MSLRTRISDDVKQAMRAGDTRRRDALRLLLAALKQKEVDERKDLGDADVIAIVAKLIKQRQEAITQFDRGGRSDLSDQEKYELGVLQTYMPSAMSDDEIESAVGTAIAQSGAKSPADMGKVMALLKSALSGRADMAKVSALVKSKLAQ